MIGDPKQFEAIAVDLLGRSLPPAIFHLDERRLAYTGPVGPTLSRVLDQSGLSIATDLSARSIIRLAKFPARICIHSHNFWL